jgi:hypothetical protein
MYLGDRLGCRNFLAIVELLADEPVITLTSDGGALVASSRHIDNNENRFSICTARRELKNLRRFPPKSFHN